MIFVVLAGVFLSIIAVGFILDLRSRWRRKERWSKVEKLARELPQEIQNVNAGLARLDTAVRHFSETAAGQRRSRSREVDIAKYERWLERLVSATAAGGAFTSYPAVVPAVAALELSLGAVICYDIGRKRLGRRRIKVTPREANAFVSMHSATQELTFEEMIRLRSSAAWLNIHKVCEDVRDVRTHSSHIQTKSWELIREENSLRFALA